MADIDVEATPRRAGCGAASESERWFTGRGMEDACLLPVAHYLDAPGNAQVVWGSRASRRSRIVGRRLAAIGSPSECRRHVHRSSSRCCSYWGSRRR